MVKVYFAVNSYGLSIVIVQMSLLTIPMTFWIYYYLYLKLFFLLLKINKHITIITYYYIMENK